MVTQIAPVTFQYSHTIGRQESRSGNGFFNPVAIARGEDNLLYVLSRGTETPAFTPCKRVTVFTVDEEWVTDFGRKVPPEDADASAPDGSFMWPTSIALDSQSNAYVADEWLNRISMFTKDGDWMGKWGKPGDADGEITALLGWLSMRMTTSIWWTAGITGYRCSPKRVSSCPSGGQLAALMASLTCLWGIEIDKNGDVYVADWRNDRIQKFAPDGRF